MLEQQMVKRMTILLSAGDLEIKAFLQVGDFSQFPPRDSHEKDNCYQQKIIIDRIALAKQGDNGIGSVRPSVRPSVCVCVCVFVRALPAEPFDL